MARQGWLVVWIGDKQERVIDRSVAKVTDLEMKITTEYLRFPPLLAYLM